VRRRQLGGEEGEGGEGEEDEGEEKENEKEKEKEKEGRRFEGLLKQNLPPVPASRIATLSSRKTRLTKFFFSYSTRASRQK
jgi:hypothetical protein